jgi:hypothetical protein
MTTRITHHLFDGESLTVAEIHRIIPRISESAIRRHLRAGRCTREAMMSFDPHEATRLGGKKTAKSQRGRGWGYA